MNRLISILYINLDLDLDLDLNLDSGSWIWTWIWTLDPASDWSLDRPPRILYLRYTGLEALPIASDNLSLSGPRIG